MNSAADRVASAENIRTPVINCTVNPAITQGKTHFASFSTGSSFIGPTPNRRISSMNAAVTRETIPNTCKSLD